MKRMMAQSVPIQSMDIAKGIPKTMVNILGSANSSKSSRQSEFEIFLGKSIKRGTKIPVKTKTINDCNAMQSKEGQEKIVSIARDNNTIQSDSSDADTQTVGNIPLDDKKPLDETDTNLVGQIMAMLSQIRDAIMDELEINPEEMESMMAELGLELTDLTDPQAIMQLILENSKAGDPLAIILDEELGDAFQGLLRTVNNIKMEADLKLSSEDIKGILQQIKDSDNYESLIIDNHEIQTQQPLIDSNNSDGQVDSEKEMMNKFQVISEDSDLNNQNPVASVQDDADLSDSQGRRDQTDKTDGYENFLDKLAVNFEKPISNFDDNSVSQYGIREIAQQIIDQIRVIINPKQTTMELQLNPEHLGKVNLTVSSREGLMTAHFIVENQLSKEAVESQMVTLKESLDQQGIKVDSIEVTVASYTFDQNSSSDETNHMMQKKQRTGHKITFEEAVAISEEPLDDDTMKPEGITGYTIDYTA